MLQYHEILRLIGLGYHSTDIAQSTGHARGTINKVRDQVSNSENTFEALLGKTDAEVHGILCPTDPVGPTKWLPDFSELRKELNRHGVTKKLLWKEYVKKAISLGYDSFGYSQFCFYFKQDDDRNRASMHILRKPGESMEVDWSGDTIELINSPNEKKVIAHIFVAVLSYSQYTYVEAFPNEGQESWISGHIHAFEFFSGVTRELIPDNCKTAVLEHKGHNFILNETYREMSEHYSTVVMPARVRAPKDKPNVEGGVGCVQRLVLAPLRDSQFFSIPELNRSIRNLLDDFNNQPFQKKEGSRRLIFEEEEKEFLLPLPSTPYELSTWKVATVQVNYHVAVEKKMYSVPWEYIGKKVDVKITKSTIEVFFNHGRIASHQRCYDTKERYVTKQEHMPEQHQRAKWDGTSFREWALRIGESTYSVVDHMLKNAKIEQQAYRSCMALLNLSSRHSEALLELACKESLAVGNASLKAVQATIKALSKHDSSESKQKDTAEDVDANPHGITRGPEYFERSKP